MPKSDVFAIHAQDDRDWLEKVLSPELARRQIHLWRPSTETRPGTNLIERLPEGVQAASLCVVVLSPRVLTGERKWMRTELEALGERGSNKQKGIVPLYLGTNHAKFWSLVEAHDGHWIAEMDWLRDRVGIEAPDPDDVKIVGEETEEQVMHYVRPSQSTQAFLGWLSLAVVCALAYVLLNIMSFTGPSLLALALFLVSSGRAHMARVPESEIGGVSEGQAKRRMLMFGAIGLLVLAGLLLEAAVSHHWWSLTPTVACLFATPASLLVTYFEWTWYNRAPHDWRTRLFELLGIPICYSTSWLVPGSGALTLLAIIIIKAGVT